jgi:hypothetical protein
VLSVKCEISNKVCIVHSRYVPETQKTVTDLFIVHITCFNTKVSAFCPYIGFVLFIVFLEDTAIISLGSIEWLVFNGDCDFVL